MFAIYLLVNLQTESKNGQIPAKYKILADINVSHNCHNCSPYYLLLSKNVIFLRIRKSFAKHIDFSFKCEKSYREREEIYDCI
mgnify:CR=1 FL=1